MKQTIKAFLAELDSIGFDDADSPVSGSDCVDVVCNHIEYLRKLVEVEPVAPRKKLQLFVKIFTDQDATMLYKDKEYCFYGQDDLIISEDFNIILEIVQVIKKEITVKEGGKATECIEEWLEECCIGIQAGETNFYVCGNLQMSIDISRNF